MVDYINGNGKLAQYINSQLAKAAVEKEATPQLTTAKNDIGTAPTLSAGETAESLDAKLAAANAQTAQVETALAVVTPATGSMSAPTAPTSTPDPAPDQKTKLQAELEAKKAQLEKETATLTTKIQETKTAKTSYDATQKAYGQFKEMCDKMLRNAPGEQFSELASSLSQADKNFSASIAPVATKYETAKKAEAAQQKVADDLKAQVTAKEDEIFKLDTPDDYTKSAIIKSAGLDKVYDGQIVLLDSDVTVKSARAALENKVTEVGDSLSEALKKQVLGSFGGDGYINDLEAALLGKLGGSHEAEIDAAIQYAKDQVSGDFLGYATRSIGQPGDPCGCCNPETFYNGVEGDPNSEKCQDSTMINICSWTSKNADGTSTNNKVASIDASQLVDKVLTYYNEYRQAQIDGVVDAEHPYGHFKSDDQNVLTDTTNTNTSTPKSGGISGWFGHRDTTNESVLADKSVALTDKTSGQADVNQAVSAFQSKLSEMTSIVAPELTNDYIQKLGSEYEAQIQDALATAETRTFNTFVYNDEDGIIDDSTTKKGGISGWFGHRDTESLTTVVNTVSGDATGDVVEGSTQINLVTWKEKVGGLSGLFGGKKTVSEYFIDGSKMTETYKAYFNQALEENVLTDEKLDEITREYNNNYSIYASDDTDGNGVISETEAKNIFMNKSSWTV